MNLADQKTEESQLARAPKTAVLLMAAIVVCLAVLAIFANIQRSRQHAFEEVRVRSMASPTPKER